eukprot:GILK01010906.1.p1 GENE.GILK01010906.1~~GILK01010906.1.p1  ORF type:complete len:168 (+),score=23.45 GILK01010906.1:44-547(+)
MNIFVTVGTTLFDALIQAIDSEDFLKTAKKKGFRKIVAQTGRGVYSVRHGIQADNSPLASLETFKYADTLDNYVAEADLIISHAGAGSVLDALRARKKLIVVINDALMDNHQLELAESLAAQRHLAFADSPLRLLHVFEHETLNFEPYPEPNFSLLPSLIDAEMGFR